MDIQGYWYDPNFNGCGFNIAEREGVVGVTYFGHTNNGTQFWLYGQGSRAHDGSLDVDMTLAEGSGFPTTSVEGRVVGTVQMREDGDLLKATLSVRHSLVNPVGTSPRPPDSYPVTAQFKLHQLL